MLFFELYFHPQNVVWKMSLLHSSPVVLNLFDLDEPDRWSWPGIQWDYGRTPTWPQGGEGAWFGPKPAMGERDMAWPWYSRGTGCGLAVQLLGRKGCVLVLIRLHGGGEEEGGVAWPQPTMQGLGIGNLEVGDSDCINWHHFSTAKLFNPWGVP